MTAYLNGVDLRSFALTTRGTRGPAQQTLHQHADLRSRRDCRLVQFVRTLAQRPGLAGHARGLKVSGLLLRWNHILPPIEGLEQIIDLLPPELRHNDRIRSALWDRE